MIQRVLSESAWADRMTAEDKRGLTPLVWGHVNPYGLFRLDMNTRLAIETLGDQLEGEEGLKRKRESVELLRNMGSQ
jgi:hypothetical protein